MFGDLGSGVVDTELDVIINAGDVRIEEDDLDNDDILLGEDDVTANDDEDAGENNDEVVDDFCGPPLLLFGDLGITDTELDAIFNADDVSIEEDDPGNGDVLLGEDDVTTSIAEDAGENNDEVTDDVVILDVTSRYVDSDKKLI